MKQKYLNKIKEENGWFFDENFECNVLLSDDLDSLLSFLLIHEYRPLWHIGYFFNFNNMYKKEGINEDLPTVGIDLSLCSGRCISNHVTSLGGSIYNKQDINLNSLCGVSLKNYHEKYNLSTFLLVYSLLGLKPRNNQECGVALSIDSAYLPYFQPKNYLDSYIQFKYLYDILEQQDMWRFQTHTDKNKFIDAIEILDLKSKLLVDNNGNLKLNMDVDLDRICRILNIFFKPEILQGSFLLQQKFKSYRDTTNSNYNKEYIYSFAITSSRTVKYSKVDSQ